MHEIGIAQNVLNAVFDELKEHAYSKIEVIELSVGEFNLLTQESLQNAFDLIAETTKAKGAVIKISQIPGMEIEIKHIEAR
ncbi:MAG: hydrogenase maturation nickel metallochaperone HypA [Candidatus Omnitrophota bacterium]